MLERFETDRLVLRPMVLEDLDLLVELDSDPEVMRYLTGKPSTRDEVAAIMNKLLGSRWIAYDKSTDAFVGWFGLVPGSEAAYDVSYRLRRDWWGRGLATEGTGTMIDVAFRSLGARRVTAQTMAVNVRSRAVMKRCGLELVRIFHAEWEDPLPGTDEGEVEYEITRGTWESAAARPVAALPVGQSARTEIDPRTGASSEHDQTNLSQNPADSGAAVEGNNGG